MNSLACAEGRALSTVERPRGASASARMGGTFVCPVYDKDGNYRFTLTASNLWTNAGLDSVLNVYIRAATQITAWYCGVIDNAGYVSITNADTSGSHTNWAEFTGYSEATRPAWSPDASSGQSVTNSTAMTVTISATGTTQLKGLFITSVSTKGASTGLIVSEAVFDQGVQTLAVGDVLKPQYALSLVST